MAAEKGEGGVWGKVLLGVGCTVLGAGVMWAGLEFTHHIRTKDEVEAAKASHAQTQAMKA